MAEHMPIGSDIDLLCKAVSLVAGRDLVSTTPLQRKLRVGFAKAARLMLLLMDYGIAGPGPHGQSPVLISHADELATIARLRDIASKEKAGA